MIIRMWSRVPAVTLMAGVPLASRLPWASPGSFTSEIGASNPGAGTPRVAVLR